MRTFILMLATASLAAVPAFADPPGHAKGHQARDARAAAHTQHRADRAQARANRAAVRHSAGHRHGGHACPPGLANRNPPCVPPGLARQAFRQGQRIPAGYRNYSTLSGLPDPVEMQIPAQYRTGYRYIYQNDEVYVVDPRTRLVQSIIDLIG